MMTFTNNVFNLVDTIYYVALKEKHNIRNLHCIAVCISPDTLASPSDIRRIGLRWAL
jgi:hypothetical protein